MRCWGSLRSRGRYRKPAWLQHLQLDVQQLAQLMIEHDVRGIIHETFHLKRINEDFSTKA